MTATVSPQSARIPVMAVVIDETGEPLWEVCLNGTCYREKSGVRAVEIARTMARSAGLLTPRG